MIYIIFVLAAVCAMLLLILGHQAKTIEELQLEIEDLNPLLPITIDADYFNFMDLPELGDDNE